MTTRPGYVWDNTALEWVSIGPVALPGSKISYQTSAPSSPATGDIWIDADDDVPSVDSSVFYRWKETAVGGETTLSGNDDNGLALKYTPGYEEVYINGVLQVRGSDYTATTGTTITGLTALVAGDIVTVMSQVAYTIGDTYTQAAADGKFVNKNVGGLNLVVPTSVTGGTVSANGVVTIGTAVSSIAVNGVFSSTYDNYKIIISGGASSTTANLQFRLGASVTGYYSSLQYVTWSTIAASNASDNNASQISYLGSADPNGLYLNSDIVSPFLSKFTFMEGTYVGSANSGKVAASHRVATSYTDFVILPTSGTLTGGTIRIYGYNNGA